MHIINRASDTMHVIDPLVGSKRTEEAEAVFSLRRDRADDDHGNSTCHEDTRADEYDSPVSRRYQPPDQDRKSRSELARRGHRQL